MNPSVLEETLNDWVTENAWPCLEVNVRFFRHGDWFLFFFGLFLLLSHDYFTFGCFFKFFVFLLGLFAILLPIGEKELVNLLFDNFESFSFKLFKFVLSFADISGLDFFVNFFGRWFRRPLISTEFTVAVSHGVKQWTKHTWPFHHQPIIFLLLFFFFFFIFFLNFLKDFFFNKFSNVPSFNAYTKLIIFGENVEFRC